MAVNKQAWTIILPDEPLELDQIVELSHEDKRYLVNTLRLQNDDKIELLNGIGTKATGVLHTHGSKDCRVKIESCQTEQMPHIKVHLILAQLKTAALEEAVKLASEVGASSIHIFYSKRTNSKQSVKIEKLQKIAYESLKISKNAFASKLHYHDDLKTCLANVSQNFQAPQFIFCDENSNESICKITQSKPKKKNDIFILIGPEASFAETERDQIQQLQNVSAVSLGSQILRAPTAALCAVFTCLQIQKN